MERVAESIREILSEILHEGMKDPGIPAILTLTHVEVSRDLRHARIHYSQLPDDEAAVAASEEAFRRGRGFLRRELGVRLPLKYLPDLEFIYDPSAQHALRIDALLQSIQSPPPAAKNEEEERQAKKPKKSKKGKEADSSAGEPESR